MCGRLREQARSHSGLGVGCWRLVGCQAAFAGKPAPTVGLGAGSWRLVGCQAAIAGKPAPTVGLGAGSWRLVGCQAAFAGKPAPTVGLGAGSWRLVGCQAAFASKLAPTVDWVWAVGVGRLGGHHHWQASSHSWIECRQLVIGRLSGRHRAGSPLQQSKSRPQALHHSMAECQLAESS